MVVQDGILAIDKACGPTSHDAVAAVRRLAGQRRVGHCGTLDPLATGVLVVCLGHYTRLAPWLVAGDKEYVSEFILGARSDTGDAQGQITPDTITPEQAGQLPDRDQVASALKQFVGTIQQVPPAHSAVKVNGVPSYRLARQQKAVKLEARSVHIARLELLAYQAPMLRVGITCTKGTYVRSLAMDLGEALGCGAYVRQLRRTRVGGIQETDAVDLDTLAREGLEPHWIPPQQALEGMARIQLDDADLERFAHGNRVPARHTERSEGEWSVWDRQGRLCGLARWDSVEASLQPVRVFLRPTG